LLKGHAETCCCADELGEEEYQPWPHTDLKVIVNLTSNLKFGAKNVLKAGYVFGEGMENYMNDAPADIAAKPRLGIPRDLSALWPCRSGV
jgi:hypothetical protein